MALQKLTSNTQQVDWPAEKISLTSQWVSVGGKTIHELLRDNHISPDVEAFSIIYVLNPQLQELRELSVPRLRIPKIEGGRRLNAIFAQGFVVFLTLDKEKKDQFNENTKKLTELIQTISEFEAEKFQDPSTREPILNSLTYIASALDEINERLIHRYGRPMPTEVLGQLNAETELLRRLLDTKVLLGAKIGKQELDKIISVEKDIRVKSAAYVEVASGDAPSRWPEVTVTVETLRGGRKVRGLRIYYVPLALKGDDSETKSFGILSTPSNQSLPEADYCFWAARDPNKVPVTNEQCKEIRIDREKVVQLTVIQ
jgi:hypothetical protein